MKSIRVKFWKSAFYVISSSRSRMEDVEDRLGLHKTLSRALWKINGAVYLKLLRMTAEKLVD